MHKPRFRGCWMPPVLFDLLNQRTISPQEVMLLMAVDSMTDPDNKPCHISNDWLARLLNVKPNHVKLMIRRLTQRGLLKQTHKAGPKGLTTAWAWPPTIEFNFANYTKGGGSPHPLASPLKGEARVGEGEHRPPRKGEKKTPSRWTVYATRLHDAISSVREIPKSARLWEWAEAISKLHKVDGFAPHHIGRVMQQYSNLIRQGDLIKDNSDRVPIAYTGAIFRQKFNRIEDGLRRVASRPQEKPEPRITATYVEEDCEDQTRKDSKSN